MIELNTDYIIDQYINYNRTLSSIAVELGVDRSVIKKRLIKNNIVIRKSQDYIKKIDDNYIIDQYINMKRCQKSIARELNICTERIRECLNNNNIEIRKPGDTKRIYLDINYIVDQYINQSKSIEIIAEELGVSYKTIERRIRASEVSLRKRGELNTINLDDNYIVDQYLNYRRSTKSIAVELGVSASTIQNRLEFNNIPRDNIYNYFTSCGEKELLEFVQSIYTNTIIENDRNLNCQNRGIKLLQFWESEWRDRQDVVKSMISNALGLSNKIYGRKCHISEIDPTTARNFFNENHLYGNNYSKINYGLIYNDELVSSMSFAKSRFNKNYEYELVRFANKLNTSVIGGASKLFKRFINEVKPESIISYADCRYSNGNLYEKLGFIYDDLTKPNYGYIINDIIESRQKYQKHKLNKLLENFDSNLTEVQNMNNHGYHQIFDAGNLRYIWNS